MGQGAALTRRALLQGGAAGTLLACSRPLPPEIPGGWIGAAHERGHRWLQSPPSLTAAPTPRRAAVLVIGAGIAGLAAARGFARQGIDDVQLLELEDTPGGNSRGHSMAGIACPLGAHYLPVPAAPADEVVEWLHEIGLLRDEFGRAVANERHLCHSPQERLFFDGAWRDGLLPPAEPGSATLAQYRRFAALVAAAPRFTIPAHRAPFGAEHAALDAQTFSAWLDARGLADARLRWYLDYCCRDDYGAGTDTVSAWAGLHYFASRHGFHAPGDAAAEREPVFTWPEGNAWLVQRLAAPLADRIHVGRVVSHVREGRGGVDVLAWHGSEAEAWQARVVVIALPLFVAARVLDRPPDALVQAARRTHHAPWLVANLLVDRLPIERPGAAQAWDSVGYGTRALGYVDALHQSLRPHAGATVLTAYTSLAAAEREALLRLPWSRWAERALAELAPVHPDLGRRVRRADLMRYGHAMAVPVPGTRADAARTALRGGRARVRFAHADLAGYSIFEEAFIAGCDAARAGIG